MYKRIKYIINKYAPFASIKNRIILLMSFFVVLVISAIIILTSLSIRRKEIDLVKMKVRFMSMEYTNKIKDDLEKSFDIARNLAQTFEKYEAIPENSRRKVINAMLKSVIEKNPELLAAWIRCEPFSIDNMDFNYGNDLLNLKGQYFKTYYRIKNEVFEILPTEKEEFTFELKDIYASPKKTKQEYLESPSFFSYSEGKYDEKFKSGFAVPIINRKRFIGTVGLDYDLDRLRKILSQFQPLKSGFGFIFSHNGTIVAHPEDKAIGKNFNEYYLGVYEKFNILAAFKKQQPVTFISSIDDSRTNYLVHIEPFSLGKTNNIWAFALAVPYNKINEEANINVYYIIFAGVLSIVLLIFLIQISFSRISLPIGVINESLKKLSKGDFNIDNNYKEILFSGSEIKEITNSINALIYGLQRTTEFADQIGKGNLNADFAPLSDKDILGNSLMEMRKNLISAENLDQQRKKEEDKQNWLNEGVALFGEIIRRNNENINELAYEIISNLVKYINANVGGLFIYNDENRDDIHLLLIASFAYNRRRYLSRRIMPGEGIIGMCALEKKTIYLTKLPDDYIEITSGLGNARPNCVIIIPLVINEQIFGIFEIASFGLFEKHVISFSEKIAEITASTILSAKISGQTKILLEQSQVQSDKMLEKEQELKRNISALEEAHEEAKERENEMNSIFKALNSSFLVAEFDTKGYLLNINEEYLLKLGLTRRNVINKNILEFLPVESKKLEEHHKLWNHLLKGINQYSVQKLEINRESVWLSHTFSPIFNNKNQVIKVLNISSDISHSKKQEEEVNKLLLNAQEKTEQLEVTENELQQTMTDFAAAQAEIEKLRQQNIALKIERDSLLKKINLNHKGNTEKK